MKKIIAALGLCIVLSPYNSKSDQGAVMINAVKSELNRTMKEFKNQPKPPYFISYTVSSIKSVNLSSSFGVLSSSSVKDYRVLDVDMRVGEYQLDNTHIIRGNPFNWSSISGNIELPIVDDEDAIRNIIWSSTDRIYKNAAERLDKVLTNKAVKVAEEDSSGDMTKEAPVKYISNWKSVSYAPGKSSEETFCVDTAKYVALIRRISAKFNNYPWILDADVNFSAALENKFFVNSEGSELKWSQTTSRIFVAAKTKADDGMSLPLYESYFAYEPDNITSEEKIMADVDAMIVKLEKLRTAPMATTYNGPAILSGEAAGVFFHEIFGHRVEGHREKDPNSSQTFKQSVGKKILPDFIDVNFDPTLKTLDGREISGFYKFDDEGVAAERVTTVENGVFKNFLMSRSPIEGFSKSNGHGRKQAGYSAVSRQSNLIVSANITKTNAELKQALIDEAKKQNKEYGLFFQTVSGGFTFTSRTIPNAFNVTPLVVYKIYVDGRPDELVRGVDLIGTPLTTFANILAASNEIGIFNGVCGAESGGVPVSACSPSLLVSTIEVQKKQKSQAKPPLLPAPAITQAP